VESSCEFGIEPSGSMKCWETIRTSLGLDDIIFHCLLTYYSLTFDEKFLVKTSMRVLNRRLH
jgi:hypothetical protein